MAAVSERYERAESLREVAARLRAVTRGVNTRLLKS
jgi:hypothetical protein